MTEITGLARNVERANPPSLPTYWAAGLTIPFSRTEQDPGALIVHEIKWASGTTRRYFVPSNWARFLFKQIPWFCYQKANLFFMYKKFFYSGLCNSFTRNYPSLTRLFQIGLVGLLPK